MLNCETLGTTFTPPTDGDESVFVLFTEGETLTTPTRRLLFYPLTDAGPEVPVAALTEAQQLRRIGNVDAALAALTRATHTQHTSIAGVPVDLFARWAECDLLAEAGRLDEVKVRAAAFRTDLYSGRWKLSRTAFEAQEESIKGWLGGISHPATVLNARALSSGVEWIWSRWRADSALETSGHEMLTLDGRDVTIFWHAETDRLAAFVASSSSIEQHWLSELHQSGRRRQLRISLRHPAAPPPARRETRQVAAETGLPWTVAVASAAAPDARIVSGRFQIWIAGVALLSLIVVGGTIVIARAAGTGTRSRAAADGFRRGGVARVPHAADFAAADWRGPPGWSSGVR